MESLAARGGGGGGGGESLEKARQKLQENVEELHRRLARHFEDGNEEAGDKPPIVKFPKQPTVEEWEKHKTTHTPYESWCPHCNAARAVRREHTRINQRAHMVKDVESNDNGPVRISMDYMYLYERSGKHKEEQWNPPHFVVIEHRFARVWAYRVPNKGIHKEANWLPKRLVTDLDNIGLQNVRIIVKIDQEPANVEVQTAMQELRPDLIIPVNSPVGESESNGRAENAIRRVQEQIRTLRHHVEQRVGIKIPDQAPIMAWLVRWAGELISKYSRGDDGKSPYERTRGKPSNVPLVPLGEQVLYLPMETAKRHKGDTAKLPGIWLGDQ